MTKSISSALALGLLLIGIPLSAREGEVLPYVAADPQFAPNPGAVRDMTIDLNGSWLFGEDGKLDEQITVPFVPQTTRGVVSESVTYKRTFLLPSDWEGALLHFEGVDNEAEIFINGRAAGGHIGAYDPFQIDVTPYLQYGSAVENGMRRHTVTVRVKDSDSDHSQLAGKQERVRNEGNIFYKNMTGIWKGVYIERVGSAYLDRLFVHGDMHGNLFVKAGIKNAATIMRRPARARITLRFENESEPVFERELIVRGDQIELIGHIPGAKLWTTETPNLYFGAVELYDESGNMIDRLQTYTGFVTFSHEGAYLTENGVPHQVLGHLNQHIYPDTLYTTTDEKVLHEIRYFKEAGFNSERFHQSSPRWRDLFLFSRYGVRISLELPSARDLRNETARRQAARQWEGELMAYSAPPCVGWTVAINETWGMLADDHHWARSPQEVVDQFQRKMHWITMATRRAMLPAAAGDAVAWLQPFNDGWQSVTHLKSGRADPSIDPRSYFVAVHDYGDAASLRSRYGAQGPSAGVGFELPHNSKPPLLDGYTASPDVPVMLSETGGRAVLSNDYQNVFVYGDVFPNVREWADEMGATIIAAGQSPITRAGVIITQTMDAGNDPADPSSGGEQNGLLRADGTPKMPAAFWLAINQESHRRWLNLLQAYSRHKQFNECESFLQGPANRELGAEQAAH